MARHEFKINVNIYILRNVFNNKKKLFWGLRLLTRNMPLLSTAGRYSEQNQMSSIQNAQVSASEAGQLPSTFHFWNGDEYTGQSAVLRDKQKVVMQGMGVYKTADGQTYEGLWENDCLKDKCKITFPGKLVFYGNLDEMVIQGPGKYKFQGKVEVEGDFINNGLIGRVHLKDPNHHMWKGKVEKNGSCVKFYPLHPFWQSVLNLPSKAIQVFYGETDEENTWEGLY